MIDPTSPADSIIESPPTPPPRVSVVIPTYNRAALLYQAVESVQRQTFRDFEILVCDDGSTDGTAQYAAGFTERTRYVALTRSGSLGRTRNRGIELARGEFIAFLDDDDLWDPMKLARQVAALDADPGAGIVYTDARLFFPDGSLSDPVLSAGEKRPGRLFLRLLRNCFFHPSSVMVRRDLLVGTGGFDESLHTGEDLDLWLRLARETREVCVPEPLVTIRRQPGSHSGASGLRAFENAILVIDRQWREAPLGLRERIACRAAVARLHARAALEALEHGDPVAARSHSRHSIRGNPLQRRAWSILRRSRHLPLAR